MSKKQLYSIIVILCAIIFYLLFMPAKAPVVETPVMVPLTATTTDEVTDTTEPVVATGATTTEQVTIEGLFLSLAEAENEYGKEFFYLMLDDGTEVVRIDLRPLLGNSLIDPISKLGVDRGTQVRVTGTMVDGKFAITGISAIE